MSEPGVYRLVFTSRKPIAERFKRWLAHEVIPAIRKTGAYVAAAAAEKPEVENDAREGEARSLKKVSECRQVFGNAAAAQLWVKLGLPIVPAMLNHARQADLFDYATLKPAPDGSADKAA